MSFKRTFSTTRPAFKTLLQKQPRPVSFVFDIDGVLKGGEKVFPNTRAVLKDLDNRKVPYIFLTNGGGVTDAARRASLSQDFDIPVGPNQLVQSHTPIQTLLADGYANEPVLIVGGKNDLGRRVAESYGLKKAYISTDVKRWQESVWPIRDLSDEDLKYTVEEDFSKIAFKAIIVINDSRDWGLDISVMSEILAAENGVLGTRKEKVLGSNQSVQLVFCNPDLLWGNDYPLPRYGAGAFRTAFLSIHQETFPEHEVEYTQYGKPHKPTYAFAEAMLRRRLEELYPDGREEGLGEVWMVGDNPKSDVKGALDYGWPVVLVKTGVYKDPEAPEFVPDRLEKDVQEGVRGVLASKGHF